MKLHNEGWSNKEIVTFLNLNGIKRRNKKDDYKVKDIFMCLKKLKIREKRKSNIKYKLGKWELWKGNNVHSILKRYTEREYRLSQKEEIAKSEISKFEVRWEKI